MFSRRRGFVVSHPADGKAVRRMGHGWSVLGRRPSQVSNCLRPGAPRIMALLRWILPRPAVADQRLEGQGEQSELSNGHNGICAHGATGWEVAGQQGHDSEQCDDRADRDRIVGADSE